MPRSRPAGHRPRRAAGGTDLEGSPPSLGGAFCYDEDINRAVSVDGAVMLVALKNVYHAQALAAKPTARG